MQGRKGATMQAFALEMEELSSDSVDIIVTLSFVHGVLSLAFRFCRPRRILVKLELFVDIYHGGVLLAVFFQLLLHKNERCTSEAILECPCLSDTDEDTLCAGVESLLYETDAPCTSVHHELEKQSWNTYVNHELEKEPWEAAPEAVIDAYKYRCNKATSSLHDYTSTSSEKALEGKAEALGVHKCAPLGDDTYLQSNPISKEQEYYGHGFVHIVNHPIQTSMSKPLKSLVENVRLGLNAGHYPVLALEGSGGVYFMKDEHGLQNAAVFKPMDEEPMAINNPRGLCSSSYLEEGIKQGTRIGRGAIREVAAYVLDHPATRCGCELLEKDGEGFAGVPLTMMVRCYHPSFSYISDNNGRILRKSKLGSLQKYVSAVASCEEMGASLFPVEEVHKITVLDLRLANTDRHAGNILVCKEKVDVVKLVPIDHGYCLPDKFGECTFEWLYWPQSSQPYSISTLKYIESLDAEQDIVILRQCGWDLGCSCARVLRVSTMLLKKGAAAGLTPFQIGSIMSCSTSADVKPPIEALLDKATAMSYLWPTEAGFLKALESLLDEYITDLNPC